MRTSSMLIGSTLLLAVAGLIGCTTAEKPATASGAHPQFETLCSKCHTLDRVRAAHQTMTPEQMKEIVKKMAAKEDSGIDPNSIDDIVNQIY